MFDRNEIRARSEGDPQPQRHVNVEGWALTNRMRRWGITGLVLLGDDSQATFIDHTTGEPITETMPAAVAEWFAERL